MAIIHTTPEPLFFWEILSIVTREAPKFKKKGTTIKANQDMEAVGTVNRAKNTSRQGAGFLQCLEGWASAATARVVEVSECRAGSHASIQSHGAEMVAIACQFSTMRSSEGKKVQERGGYRKTASKPALLVTP